MSLKLIKHLVAFLRQAYYCRASKWDCFFLILLGWFMLWKNGTVGKSESAIQQKRNNSKVVHLKKKNLILPARCKDWLNQQNAWRKMSDLKSLNKI